MATKGEGKMKKKEKGSAKKLEDALHNIGTSETPQAEESESTDMQEQAIEEPVVPKDPSPEPVYDEPTLSELIVVSFSGDKERGLYHGEGEAKFSGDHEYKGQFSEGFMHGKGCYKWADGVVYEGEFMRNQVTGKGVYSWPDSSTYDGEVVCGKRHGFGIFKCKNNKMSYSGEWAMGKRHGKGRMEYDTEGKSYYDGDWVNNVRHGWGTRQYPTGNLYQGMWFNNVRHGEGTMKWMDRDQIYSGQWENGIQHGVGKHYWLLRRVHGSQYPLRNMFEGEFVNGLRHGFGTFYYANGAKYEGGWKNNMKHGKGKFTFKNGRIYEGQFERDHIVEYPEFTMDGTTSPDLSNIRTRTPLPMDNISVHSNESRNTISPSFQLDLDYLLNEFTEADRDDEASQVMFVITRHISSLRRIYSYYSSLGYEDSPDNTYVMNKMQFWRFLKDAQLHHKEKTLMEMDRMLGKTLHKCTFKSKGLKHLMQFWQFLKDAQFHHKEKTLMDMDRMLGVKKTNAELHNPDERILQRQFVNNLIVLAYHLYHKEHKGTTPVLAWCVSRLISDHILRYACNVKGNFYYETRRAVNALEHQEKSYEIYQALCSPRKYEPKEDSFKMRQFLHMMKDLKLINNDLTAQGLIEVLASDDPSVTDGEGCYNLELEMTFLEFFEALIGCAEKYVTLAVVKDPSTPRPSTSVTKDESMYSIPGSPSRLTSQVGLDDHSEAQGSPREPVSPETASPTRAVSSAEGTGKTLGDGVSSKHEHAGQSHSNVTAVNSDVVGHGDDGSKHDSAKDGQLGEHQKSASFVSTHTNQSEDNIQLVQSSGSIDGHGEGEEEGEGHTQDDYDEEEDLDESTRQFNFWTHQIHIFFGRKFLPAAQNMIRLKQAVDKRMLEDSKLRCESSAALVEQVQVVIEEKTQA